jgi:hypothetical protein
MCVIRALTYPYPAWTLTAQELFGTSITGITVILSPYIDQYFGSIDRSFGGSETCRTRLGRDIRVPNAVAWEAKKPFQGSLHRHDRAPRRRAQCAHHQHHPLPQFTLGRDIRDSCWQGRGRLVVESGQGASQAEL